MAKRGLHKAINCSQSGAACQPHLCKDPRHLGIGEALTIALCRDVLAKKKYCLVPMKRYRCACTSSDGRHSLRTTVHICYNIASRYNANLSILSIAHSHCASGQGCQEASVFVHSGIRTFHASGSRLSSPTAPLEESTQCYLSRRSPARLGGLYWCQVRAETHVSQPKHSGEPPLMSATICILTC